MAFSELNPVPAQKCRPLWQRLVALMLCELVILQPGLATAQVSQLPNFTVSGLPPNVMLMFDDSGSMARLDLPIPPDLPALTATNRRGVAPNFVPVLKLDTVNYFGIRGVGYAAGPQTAANLPQFDNAWSFLEDEVRERAAAFNPLAYNPMLQYKPWNDNGAVMTNAPYGGNGLTAAVPYTPWDMRNLPTPPFDITPRVSVRSKIAGASGRIMPAGAVRTFVGPPMAGSVDYAGLVSSTNSVAGAEAEGDDLFSSTIWWDNPYCALPVDTDNYGWFCPVGGPWGGPPTEVCNLASNGTFSTTGQCCVPVDAAGPDEVTWQFRSYLTPPATPFPPTVAPPASDFSQPCTNGIGYVDSSFPPDPGTCTTTTPPPRQVTCPVGVEGECYVQDPDVETCTGTLRYDRWACYFLQPTTVPTCPAPTYRQCHFLNTTTTCGSLEVLDAFSPARYKGGYWTPARYAVYEGPASATPAERADMSNYRMVMIDRKFAWNATIPGRDPAHPAYRYRVVDALTGATSYRPDCDAPPSGTGNAGQNGTWCTFEQEAQNYANWYTYYRTRLFSSVAVVSDVLSNFTGAEQRLRMGYGRINYFKDGRNPWDVNSFAPYYTALPKIDSATVNNPGAIERGVREFLVSDPIGARADVFKWLFSISPRGPTPNREAMHAVGRYFQRADTFNPYVDNPHPPSNSPGEELWCRRNYAVLATDGEWTKLPTGQPRIDDGATHFPGAGDNPVTSGVTTSMSTLGAAINGILPNGSPRPPPPFTYDPAVEVQITGGSGTQTATLTDVTHYYWSHDLRPELVMKNGHLETPTNRAFWQHLSTYIVGYGVSASMDDDTIRPRFFTPAPRVNIPWPNVGLEACRQLDNNAEDDALPTPNCAFVEPAGNRINDTLRAALAGGGDFFSAASPAELRNNLASVFEAIVAVPASGTSPSFSNTTLVPGSVFVRSNFRTNVWDGFVEAFDAQAYLDFLGGTGPLPATEWTDNYAAHDAPRNIATSTAQLAAADFLWCNLNVTQRNALDPLAAACTTPPYPAPAIVDYLRGDQSNERRFTGGVFRDRRTTILGDIVNSSPVYEKATDDAYHLRPEASFNAAAPHGYTLYRTYITDKQNAAHIPIVMFGANDGMFHVLNATSGSGREIFAYVPRAVYPLLRPYADPAYVHRYTVDGPVVRGDVLVAGVWKTIAIGTTGAGPPGIFAIDITDPTTLNFSNVKWDIVPSDNATTAQYLGKTIGAGVIGSVKLDADNNVTTTPNGQWAYIVGNGYESTSDRAALLVFNALNGNLIQALPVPMSAGPGNGLGAITPVYDGSRNIINVYAGDKKGNLWKFDLTSSNPANWKIANEDPPGLSKPLFAAGNNSPILQAPRVTIHPRGGLYVAFGTGKYFEVGDPADNNDQSIFAVWDKGQLADIRSTDVPLIRIEEDTTAAGTFKRLNVTDLGLYRANTAARGFQLRLRPDASAGNGERIIAPLILDAGVLVATSFSPEAATDRCVPGGTSFLYRIDLTGGFSRGSFGTEGALTIGRKLNPGTVGSLTPVYTPVDPGATLVDEMTAADIKTMMEDPKYRLGGGTTPNQQGALGACLHVGLDVVGGVARIPTNCLGLMPLRAWRPFR